MSVEFNEDKSIVQIEEYNLYDFLVCVQKQVLNGYRVTDQNEYFPQGGMGSFYRVGLVANPLAVPIQVTEEGVIVDEVVTEVVKKPVAINTKPGRPSSKAAAK